MTREELLESLAVERMTNPWWTTHSPIAPVDSDDDLTTARRRRLLAADYDTTHAKEA